MRFIQLPGDSPPLYVSQSSFSQRDSSWFDWKDEEAVLFPNWETRITWFENGITSSSQLLWDLFNFLMILHHFMYPNQASHKEIHPGLVGRTKKLCYFPNWETRITWFESGITSSSQLLWGLFNFLMILHHFIYPNQVSHKVIHPGLIGRTKKLCYSQFRKLESPDLKMG